MRSSLLCTALCGLASGLQVGLPASPSAAARTAGVCMPAADVIEKKAKVVDQVKGSMEKAAMIFSVRTEGIKVNDMNRVRQKLPEDVDVTCAKSTLVRTEAWHVPPAAQGT